MDSIAVVTFVRCCRSLLLAGQETTASTLSWFLWEMARHPESQERIREEIAVVYRRVNGAELSIADLDSMAYTQAAFKVVFLLMTDLFVAVSDRHQR
jgi:cytochrome P450